MPLTLDIVTPEKRVLSEIVDTVVLPGSEGELGILPHHIPLVTALKPGELSYVKGGKQEFLAVGSGFVEISGDKVSVLTDVALGEDSIDESSVEEALKRAQAQLEAAKNDPASEEFAHLQVLIQKSMAQLNVKRKRRAL